MPRRSGSVRKMPVPAVKEGCAAINIQARRGLLFANDVTVIFVVIVHMGPWIRTEPARFQTDTGPRHHIAHTTT
jgi:hypothetical protein